MKVSLKDNTLVAAQPLQQAKRQPGPAFRPVEAQKRAALPLIKQLQGASYPVMPPLLQHHSQTLYTGPSSSIL